MKIFREKQYLKRLWLIWFMLAILLSVVGSVYFATLDFKEDSTVLVSILGLAIAVPLVFALASVKLESRIDREGITAQFTPFKFARKYFSWKDLEKTIMKEFNPVKVHSAQMLVKI